VRRLRRLVPSLVAAAVVPVLWWAGLPVLAVLVALVGGLSGLLYVIAGDSDGRTGTERGGHERVQRDIPPPS
jgi:Flp pilus assembly protein TadB